MTLDKMLFLTYNTISEYPSNPDYVWENIHISMHQKKKKKKKKKKNSKVNDAP